MVMAASATYALPLHHVGGGSTQPPNIVTTITLVNPSASSYGPADGGVTPLIGLSFPKGVIASGTWPTLKYLSSGSYLTCQYTLLNNLATTWSDGSLKFVPACIAGLASIAGNGGTFTIYIWSGGTLPASSSRGTGDLPTTLSVQVAGLDNLAGTWTAGPTSSSWTIQKSISYGNGQAGAFGKIRAAFNNGSGDHGQLVCDFYWAALANSNGSLKGVRILGKVKLPYFDVSTGGGVSTQQNWVTFNQFQMMLGATVVQDMMATGPGAAGKFGSASALTVNGTSASITNYTNANPGVITTSVNHGLVNGQNVVVSGATPSGFNGSGLATVIDATHFSIGKDTTSLGAYSGGGTASSATFNSPGHGFSTVFGSDSGYACRVTNGLLPAQNPNQTSSSTFFLRVLNSNQMQFSSGSNLAVAGSGFQQAQATGSGTCTIYPMLAYFGSLFVCQSTADPVWIGSSLGVGSDAADTPLYHKVNTRYVRAAKVVPPYDLGASWAPSVLTNVQQLKIGVVSYWPNSATPITRSLETTGERDDIGILSAWYSRHFFTQDPGDRQFVRVISLDGMQLSIGFERSDVMTYPCLNNGHGGGGGTYSGMTEPEPTTVWAPDITASVWPKSGGGTYTDYTVNGFRVAGFAKQQTDHIPQFCYYPYLLTGEPWHLDGLLELSQNALLQLDGQIVTASISPSEFAIDPTFFLACRNARATASSTYRYGVTSRATENGFRTGCWATGYLVCGAGICPDTSPDCSSYKQYFNDMRADTALFPIDIINQLNTSGCTFAATNGLWMIPQNKDYWMDQYHLGYFCSAAFLGAALCEDNNLLTCGQYCVQWIVYVSQSMPNHSGWSVYAEECPLKITNVSGGGPIPSASYVAFGISGTRCTWSPSGFVWTPKTGNPQNYVMQNNDILMFVPTANQNVYNLPQGTCSESPCYALFIQYYVVNYNSSTGGFQLSATLGGTPIANPTDTNNSQIWLVPSNPPSTGGQDSYNNPECFGTIQLHGALKYYQALGGTDVQVPGLAAAVADLAAREAAGFAGAGNSFATDPKYSETSSFV